MGLTSATEPKIIGQIPLDFQLVHPASLLDVILRHYTLISVCCLATSIVADIQQTWLRE